MKNRNISPQQLYERMQRGENLVLLDVRSEEKYREFHINEPGFEVINIPKTIIFEDKHVELPNEVDIIVTCTTGNSASKCSDILSEQNYRTFVLEGGMTGWKKFLDASK
jgi:rhodanese-related sulfurtransferase